jgi:agmatinase
MKDFQTPDEMVEKVYENVKRYLSQNKFVTLVGGEHSVSIGSIKAFIEEVKDLTVLHIDAHSDLRKEYSGSKNNHACALHEASQKTNLIQVGIRSMDKCEKAYMNLEKVYFSHDMVCDEYWADNAVAQMTENVYITFDLDAFDPAIMPSTGTPEPGGMLWNETLDFLESVFTEKNVVGFDIMELCPNENEKSSDFLAAKLYYKMLTYKYKLKNKNG